YISQHIVAGRLTMRPALFLRTTNLPADSARRYGGVIRDVFRPRGFRVSRRSVRVRGGAASRIPDRAVLCSGGGEERDMPGESPLQAGWAVSGGHRDSTAEAPAGGIFRRVNRAALRGGTALAALLPAGVAEAASGDFSISTTDVIQLAVLV